MPIHPRTFILINLLLKLYKLSHLLSLRFKSLTSLIQSYQSQTNGEGEEQRGERGCIIWTTLFLPQIQVDVITTTTLRLTGRLGFLKSWSTSSALVHSTCIAAKGSLQKYMVIGHAITVTTIAEPHHHHKSPKLFLLVTRCRISSSGHHLRCHH